MQKTDLTWSVRITVENIIYLSPRLVDCPVNVKLACKINNIMDIMEIKGKRSKWALKRLAMGY